MINLDDMARAYLEAQLWAQLDSDNPSCDCHASDPENACHNHCLDERYSLDDIAPAYVQSVRDELQSVLDGWPELVQRYHDTNDYRLGEWSRSELFGHDFYLTREGHGAGFWDRGLGDLGDRLTEVAKSYGSAAELYESAGTLVA